MIGPVERRLDAYALWQEYLQGIQDEPSQGFDPSQDENGIPLRASGIGEVFAADQISSDPTNFAIAQALYTNPYSSLRRPHEEGLTLVDKELHNYARDCRYDAHFTPIQLAMMGPSRPYLLASAA